MFTCPCKQDRTGCDVRIVTDNSLARCLQVLTPLGASTTNLDEEYPQAEAQASTSILDGVQKVGLRAQARSRRCIVDINSSLQVHLGNIGTRISWCNCGLRI